MPTYYVSQQGNKNMEQGTQSVNMSEPESHIRPYGLYSGTININQFMTFR